MIPSFTSPLRSGKGQRKEKAFVRWGVLQSPNSNCQEARTAESRSISISIGKEDRARSSSRGDWGPEEWQPNAQGHTQLNEVLIVSTRNCCRQNNATRLSVRSETQVISCLQEILAKLRGADSASRQSMVANHRSITQARQLAISYECYHESRSG